MAMLWSQQAEEHWNCTADLRGRDGRDGKMALPVEMGGMEEMGRRGKVGLKESKGREVEREIEGL